MFSSLLWIYYVPITMDFIKLPVMREFKLVATTVWGKTFKRGSDQTAENLLVGSVRIFFFFRIFG